MGDWAVVMPNKAGEKITSFSQTPSIISVHLRTAEFIWAAEDGYSITYSAGKWFTCYIHAKLTYGPWTKG